MGAIILALNPSTYDFLKFYGFENAYYPRITADAAADLASVPVSGDHRYFTLGNTAGGTPFNTPLGLQEAIGTNPDDGGPTGYLLPPGHSYKVVKLSENASPEIHYATGGGTHNLPFALARDLAGQLGRSLLNGDFLDYLGALAPSLQVPLILPKLANSAVSPLVSRAWDYLKDKLGLTDDASTAPSEGETFLVVCMPSEYPSITGNEYPGRNLTFTANNTANIGSNNQNTSISDSYNHYSNKLADHLNIVFGQPTDDNNREDKKDFLRMLADSLDILESMTGLAQNLGGLLKGALAGMSDTEIDELLDTLDGLLDGVPEMQAAAKEFEKLNDLLKAAFFCEEKGLACITADTGLTAPADGWESLLDRYFMDPHFSAAGAEGSLAWKAGHTMEISHDGWYYLS